MRLPFAAIKNLGDYGLIEKAPAVSFGPELNISRVQRSHLKWALPEAPAPVVPRLTVDVKWNFLILARVNSGHYVGPTGQEYRDSLYFCLFGAWIPLYTYSHVMA